MTDQRGEGWSQSNQGHHVFCVRDQEDQHKGRELVKGTVMEK